MKPLKFANSIRIDGSILWYRGRDIVFSVDFPSWVTIAYCAVAEFFDPTPKGVQS